MDNEIIAHNIASIASKLYFTNDDILKYKIKTNGYSEFIDDLTTRYIEAYTQAKKELPKPQSKNMECSNKPFIKM